MNLISKVRAFDKSVVVGLLCVLLLLAVVAVIIWNERLAARAYEKTDAEWSLIARPITERDHTVGDINAPIQLIVYSDFQCKYCGSFFAKTFPKLQRQFGNQIVIAYRHLPLAAQPQSQPEAEASECIYQLGGNEAFWRFAREMYAIPGFEKGIDLSRLPSMAADTGVKKDAYNACVKRGAGKDRIAQDKLEGSVAGLSITPSIILKSAYRATIVQGDYYSQLSAAISYLLETNAQIEARQ